MILKMLLSSRACCFHTYFTPKQTHSLLYYPQISEEGIVRGGNDDKTYGSSYFRIFCMRMTEVEVLKYGYILDVFGKGLLIN